MPTKPSQHRLDARRPEVVALLADDRTLSVWEMLRRFGAPTAVADLASACGLARGIVQLAIDRLAAAGLASRVPASRGNRQIRYRTTASRILVEIDPAAAADRSLLSDTYARFAAESRAAIDASMQDALRGKNGFGRKHAFTHLALDEREAKELLSLFAAIDAFVARMEERHDGKPHGTPALCNYHLALHVAPVEARRLPPARLSFAHRNTVKEHAASFERRPKQLLSPRELDVARRLAAGDTLREIASALGISASTVKTLCERIYRKLGIGRRAQLAARLHGLGIGA